MYEPPPVSRKLVPSAVRLPLTENTELLMLNWLPAKKVTVPASVSVDPDNWDRRHVGTDRHRSTGGHGEAVGNS